MVPDLPGCFSAGETLGEARIQAEDAITDWIEAAIDAGQDIPAPSNIEALRAAHAEFDGWPLAISAIASPLRTVFGSCVSTGAGLPRVLRASRKALDFAAGGW